MNRAQRRAQARPKANRPLRARPERDPVAGLRLVHRARPYEPGEMVDQHLITRAAFERLRDGSGTEDDFGRVAMCLNVGLVRAEQIHPDLVAITQAGQDALARSSHRYRGGLRLGFDAQGLQDVPAALDAYEAVMDQSSPLQMQHAIQAAWGRIWDGDTLGVMT